MRTAQRRLCGIAFALTATAAFAATSAEAKKSATDPAEACTTNAWGYLRATDDEWGTLNLCRYPIDIWFVAKGGSLIHSTVAPGATFRTGLPYSTFNHKSGWIAATCRTGTAPSPEVSEANWDAILNSHYACKKP